MKRVNTIGLTREAYFSGKRHNDKQARIFSNNWSFAGVLSDVQRNGDYTCTNVGRNSLFVKSGTMKEY